MVVYFILIYDILGVSTLKLSCYQLLIRHWRLVEYCVKYHLDSLLKTKNKLKNWPNSGSRYYVLLFIPESNTLYFWIQNFSLALITNGSLLWTFSIGRKMRSSSPCPGRLKCSPTAVSRLLFTAPRCRLILSRQKNATVIFKIRSYYKIFMKGIIKFDNGLWTTYEALVNNLLRVVFAI